jgi:hypothetical protein
LKISRKMNIPMIINAKFHAFIFFETGTR